MKCYVETELKMNFGTKRKYLGRFLGFIKDEEYKLLLGNGDITSRVETGTTKDLIKSCVQVNKNNWGLNGIRFVLVVRKIDGYTTMKKLLVVSDKLNYISEMKPDNKEVMFVTMKGEHVLMKEREGKSE